MGFISLIQPHQGIPVLGLVFISMVSLLLATLFNARGRKKRAKWPPEPAGRWPIIGHLHLLRGEKLLHRTFADMADKYGPVFCVRLGLKKTLVVSSWEVAKECYTVNDKAFATRPWSIATKLMAYDHAMLGFVPYGPYWRHVRKLVVAELLSNHQQLQRLRHVRSSEINLFMQQLYGEWAAGCNHRDKGKAPAPALVVDMKERFENLLLNVMLRAVVGKRCFGIHDGGGHEKERRRGKEALEDVMLLLGLPMVSDAVPFLGWVDRVRGYTGKMKRISKEIDCILGECMEEHRQRRLSENFNAATNRDDDYHDFLHSMLSALDDTRLQFPGYDPETIIKSTCLNLILGGYDTTAVTLTWALSLLLNNRHVLEKAQVELETMVGTDRQVEGSDIKKLVYLQAVVKETLRLHSPGQLSVPHESMEDCVVGGFHVEAGTRLLINLWKMHRDPGVWSEPLEFRPERFLTENEDVGVRGQNYELLPFGSGRRICPGIPFALEMMHLTLARLLHGFGFGLVGDSPVDMTEGLGLSSPKATPLEVTIVPRLRFELYSIYEAP